MIKYIVDNKVKYDLSELEYSPASLGGTYFDLNHEVFAKASEELGIILDEPKFSEEEIDKRKAEYNFQKLLYQKGKKYLSEDEIKEYQKEIGRRLDLVEDGLSTLIDSDIVLEQLYLDELIGFEQLRYPELKEKLLKEHNIRPIDLSYFPETSKEKKGPIDNLSLLSTYYYQGTLTSSQLVDFYINNQISANTFNQMAEAIHLEMEFDKIFDEEKMKQLGFNALTNISKEEITSKFARYHDIALRYSKNPEIEDIIYRCLDKTKAKKSISVHNIENLYKAKLLSPKDIEKLGTKYWGILLNSKRFNVRPTDLKIAFRDKDGKVDKRNKLEELFLNEFNTNNAKTNEERENLFEIRKNLLEQIYLNPEFLEADDENYRYFVTNGYVEFDEADKEERISGIRVERGEGQKRNRSDWPWIRRLYGYMKIDDRFQIENRANFRDCRILHLPTYGKVIIEAYGKEKTDKEENSKTKTITNRATYIVDEQLFESIFEHCAISKGGYEIDLSDKTKTKYFNWDKLIEARINGIPGVDKVIHAKTSDKQSMDEYFEQYFNRIKKKIGYYATDSMRQAKKAEVKEKEESKEKEEKTKDD